MKIALHQTGNVGFRTGQILLGDSRVQSLGLVDRTPADSRGGRVTRAENLAEYDLLVTDDPDPASVVIRATESRVSCTVWVEPELNGLDPETTTVLVGSNLAAGIAPCLASHEVARLGGTATIAWTEPGSPLRSGEPLAFPDPVGGRWGRRFDKTDPTRFVAPVAGDWAAALAKVTAPKSEGGWTRIVGVADLAPHLEALALAAGALSVAEGAYGAGISGPAGAPEGFLAEALNAGLDVAAYTLPPE